MINLWLSYFCISFDYYKLWLLSELFCPIIQIDYRHRDLNNKVIKIYDQIDSASVTSLLRL